MSNSVKIIGFISARLNSPCGMPRSIKVMRAVAATGIAVAVAALIIAVSIGRGFEKTYTRALLDFNSHVIVMGTGEIENPDEVLASLRAFEFSSDDERRLAARYGWLAAWMSDARGLLERSSLIRFVPQRVLIQEAAIEKASRKGVIAATPFLYREALIVGGGEIRGVVVKGIDPATQKGVSGMSIALFDGSNDLGEALTSDTGADTTVIVGESLARELGLNKSHATLRMMVPGKDH
ncbi:MAG: ABC transporter permease, partial [bacterium]